MQAALTTPATRTRCARTSTGSPTFPRRKGGTGGCSWGLLVRGAAEAEDLEYHPKVALRCEERELGAAELAAEDHVVLTLGPRNSLIEVRCGHGDVMYALTFLGKETRIDAVLVEWLDKLPHHLADRGEGAAVGALDRLTVLAVVIRLTQVDLSELPRADAVVVHVPPYRRLQIAHDDPELHRFVEDGLSHRSPPLRACADRLATFHTCRFSERLNGLLISL